MLRGRALTDPQSEVIKRVLVDDIQLPNKSKCKLHHCANVHVLSVVFLRVMKRKQSQGTLVRDCDCLCF